jgi:hypothetical protein
MAKQPVTIQRQKDGRHHVMDGDGNVLGKHKSIWSAARQIHEYMMSGAQDQGPGNTVRPVLPHPSIPKPPQSTAPNEQPQRIPRP